MKKETNRLKLIVFAIIAFIACLAMFSCSRKVYTVTETKMFHEIYIKANESQLRKIERRCLRNGITKPSIEILIERDKYILSCPHYYLNLKETFVWIIPRKVEKTKSNEY